MDTILTRYRDLLDPAFEHALVLDTDPRYKELYDGALYAVRGGKHVRPQLCLAVAEVYNLDLHELLPFALAVEFIHAYSLVHDDLPAMDNDDYRHGKPSVHKAYGEAMAILIGDYLQNRAYEILFQNVATPGGRRAAQRLAKAAGGEGMIAGQVMDINAELKDPEGLPNEVIVKMHRDLMDLQEKKTAALLTASLLMPLDFSEQPAKDIALWEKFAYELGLAFQLKDDLLDIEAERGELGKSLGKDERDAKLTYPRLIGEDKARDYYASLTRSLDERLQSIRALPGIGKNLAPVEAWTRFLTERSF